MVIGIVLIVSPALATPRTDWDREGARRAWEEANKLHEALDASTPSRESYLRCIRTYQQVYSKDPHFSSSPEAIYEAAVLFQEMGEKFGDLSYYRNAVRLFSFLISDYGGSRRCPEALLNLGLVNEKHLGDKAAAEDAYAKLKSRYGSSAAAASLNARLKAARTLSASSVVPQTLRRPEPPPIVQSLNRVGKIVQIREVRLTSDGGGAHISVVSDGQVRYSKSHLSSPERLYFDITGARADRVLLNKTFPGDGYVLRQVRVAQNQADVVRIVLDLGPPETYTVSDLSETFGISISVAKKGSSTVHAAPPKTRPTTPTAFADKSVQLPPEVLASVKPPEPNPVTAKPEVPARGQTPVPNGAAKGDAGVVWQAQLPQIDTSLVRGADTKGPVPAKPEPERQASVQVSTSTASSKTNPGNAAQIPSGTGSAASKSRPEGMRADLREAAPTPPNAPEQKTTSAPPSTTKPESKPQVGPASPAARRETASPAQVSNEPKSANPGAEKLKDAAKADIPRSPITPEPSSMPKTAIPTSKGDRTLTRMLGLKIGRIVLDPGHGGHDMGTIGPSGLLEKDLVLQVAKELKKLLQEKLGAEVILTRSSDTFISLEERTEIANQQQADLFLSIHANSSARRNISGVETYFLDFARNDAAREVAARENAISDRNVRDLQDLIQKIAQADKKAESREFAEIIQKNLYSGVHKMIPSSQDRGVRSAPFIVLIGAHMPSVLAEVAFISNPRDEKLLKKEVNCQSLAAALFRGVEGYMKALGSGVAQNHGHSNY